MGQVVVLLLIPALIGTIASLVIRYRKASEEVRAQIKWVAVGGFLQIAVGFMLWVAEILPGEDYPIQAVLVGMVSTLIIPFALAVAILKYRLYDIDHLVSRTVSYAVLAGVLGAFFVGGVLGAQAVLGATSDLAVAATTLAVAAIFDPLRRRLHGVMDRRFNRGRFDAERVVEAFTTRMSAVTTTESLSSDLADTVEATLAPESFGIWIRNS
jgi:uncharacterized membrane protein YdcZ (DUF606 family)